MKKGLSVAAIMLIAVSCIILTACTSVLNLSKTGFDIDSVTEVRVSRYNTEEVTKTSTQKDKISAVYDAIKDIGFDSVKSDNDEVPERVDYRVRFYSDGQTGYYQIAVVLDADSVNVYFTAEDGFSMKGVKTGVYTPQDMDADVFAAIFDKLYTDVMSR